MTTLFAPAALLPDGWAENVIIEVDRDGWIAGVDTFKKQPGPDQGAEILAGAAVPGMPNVHSHAFQRGMAGLAERAAGRKRNFWSWRDTMYRFTGFITEDDMEALAAQVYVELLKSGFTSVGEFHYLHHRPDGTPHPAPAAMSRQILRAALETGMAITHMPALYAHGDFGGAPPVDAQKRFLNTVPALMRILEDLQKEYAGAPQVTLGLAHHSLRAVGPEMMREGTKAARALLPGCPVHILAAAQVEEVESCLAWSGRRPVAWLAENAGIDENWCIVHATHVDDEEVRLLAQSGAVAGLTPSTEANMGSGIFPLSAYFEAGGRFALGTGSHINTAMPEELRWLEYTQRLTKSERTVITRADLPSSGATLYEQCVAGGAQALGRRTGRIAPGFRADIVVLDTELPVMTGRLRDHILDTAIFAGGDNPVRDVMSGGRWAVRNRHHKREEQVFENFRKVMLKAAAA